MKILFLDPPHRPWEFFKGRVPSPGLLSIIPYAVRRACAVSVLDLSVTAGAPNDAIKSRIKAFAPDVIAISGAKSAFAYETLNCAALCRKYSPASLLTGGGNFLTSYSTDVVSRGIFDIIARGEGEETFDELIKTLDGGGNSSIKDISGIEYSPLALMRPCEREEAVKKLFGGFTAEGPEALYADHGTLLMPESYNAVRTPARPLIEDLDSLPNPAFEYFEMERYEVTPLGGFCGFVYGFSRGCGRRCSFCSDSAFWSNRWRGFGAARCIEILKTLSSVYGRNIIYFGDADFLWSRERNLEFCDRMAFEKKKGALDINFWMQSSVDKIIENKDLFPALRSAGLYQVMCGFETLSSGVQKTFEKMNPVPKMTEASEIVRNSGALMMGMLMWGDYGDDEGTLRKSIDFMVEHCDVIGPNTVVPHYGTRYFDECEKRGLIDKLKALENDQCEIIMPMRALGVESASKLYKEIVLKTLISKKKFIGNYLSAADARVKNILRELSSKGYVGK